MKNLLCKFANYILRKCTSSEIGFNKVIYINGRGYELIKATCEITPNSYKIINFEVRDSKYSAVNIDMNYISVCDDCSHLNMTEEEQNYFKSQYGTCLPHLCIKYNKRVTHYPLEEPHIHPCKECLEERKQQ